MDEMKCPKCGEECDRDSVDVGVGVIHGPWACFSCGWSEDDYYDRSEGPSLAQKEHPNHNVDSKGVMTSLDRIAEKLDKFGLDGDKVVDEVFRV